MIEIRKTAAPTELVILQQDCVDQGLTANEAYKKLSGARKVRVVNQLMQDQGYLCAYCMRRIPDKRDSERGVKDPTEVRIEHWDARNRVGGTTCGAFGALDYYNMLAVCSGNQNSPLNKKSKLTCDAKCGNRKLTVNPLDASTLTTIYYTEDGYIKASDPVIDDDLNVGLNLNCTKDAVQLPAERKKVLEVIQEEIMSEIENGNSFLECCTSLYNELMLIDDEKPPYIGISLWWLKDTVNKADDT